MSLDVAWRSTPTIGCPPNFGRAQRAGRPAWVSTRHALLPAWQLIARMPIRIQDLLARRESHRDFLAPDGVSRRSSLGAIMRSNHFQRYESRKMFGAELFALFEDRIVIVITTSHRQIITLIKYLLRKETAKPAPQPAELVKGQSDADKAVAARP
jgi:hypothetical protein